MADSAVEGAMPLVGRERKESEEEFEEEEMSLYEKIRLHAHLLLDVPHSSTAAQFVGTFILICILASTVCFCVETVPSYEDEVELWWTLEVFFTTVFSAEYITRFWACQGSRWEWFCQPMNVIDMLAIVPFYIELLMVKLTGVGMGGNHMRILRTLRLTRVFRVLKMGRYSRTLQLIASAFSRSVEALALLLFFLVVGLIFFGAAMHMVEQGQWNHRLECSVRQGENDCSPFQSVVHTFYWGITTMTTVGYGDTLPTTPAGKLVASMAMVMGVLFIALPVTMIGNAFTEAFEEVRHEASAKELKEQLQDAPGMLQRSTALCRKELRELQENFQRLVPRLEELITNEIGGTAAASNVLHPSLGILDTSVQRAFAALDEYVTLTLKDDGLEAIRRLEQSEALENEELEGPA